VDRARYPNILAEIADLSNRLRKITKPFLIITTILNTNGSIGFHTQKPPVAMLQVDPEASRDESSLLKYNELRTRRHTKSSSCRLWRTFQSSSDAGAATVNCRNIQIFKSSDAGERSAMSCNFIGSGESATGRSVNIPTAK
jgi:hypothetical protein